MSSPFIVIIRHLVMLMLMLLSSGWQWRGLLVFSTAVMPTNIEIKAVIRDWSRACQAATAVSDIPVQIIEQEDTFFTCPHGRLKLRQFSAHHGELIA